MKNLWITALEKDPQCVQQLIATAGKYGLGADGHFWQDELAKMAWLAIKEQLLDKKISLWIIVGKEDDLTPDMRYGLTLLRLALQLDRPALPILWLDSAGKMDKTYLPGIFVDTPFMAAESPTLGAKFAALANIPLRQLASPYRLQVHANPGFGVWFEVGPGAGEEWAGGLFGVNQGEIKSHGVGERGRIPEKCVLNYPLQGMELQSGDDSYLAWGVKNPLGEEDSYFVKVDGPVHSILFGEFPEGEAADLHILKM